MTKTIGIISIKGGVGKTTIASSLASSLVNHYNKKVLLVDANYSAPNLGLHMDIIKPKKTIHEVLDKKAKIKKVIENKFGVDVIPGDYSFNKNLNYLKLKSKLKKIKNNYDFVILDSSPSLNEEILSVIIASDSLFVVTTPDYPTLYCTLKASKLAKHRGKPISGIILNKIRSPFYELTLKEIEKTTEIPVVAKIPDDKSAVKATFMRIPLTVYNKNSRFSREILKLCAAISNKKEKHSIIQHILPFNFRREEVNRQILRDSFYNPYFK